MRLQSSASDIWSEHQRLIDFLELLAGNEPQNIGQHDEGNDKSENQTPRRHMRDDVQQERRIGPRNRNRKIGREHVRTPVTNALLVCRLLIDKQKNKKLKQPNTYIIS